MTRAINDATPSKVGDIYQHIIALKDCFELKIDEYLLIERCGDVSIISKNGSGTQKEVKHHMADDELTDRDIDFWKTLSNWYVSYNDIIKFNSLILYTTSKINLHSKLYDWNNKTKEEKLSLLVIIGKQQKQREAIFRREYDKIFNDRLNKEHLLNILDKFSIEEKQENIANISRIIYPKLLTIPDENKDNFIAALLGVIQMKVSNPPHKWEISYNDFHKAIQLEACKYYRKDIMPLPTDYANQKPDKYNSKSLLEKIFIKAIKDINYDEVIPEALSDYWKTSMTIAKYFQNNPAYFRDLNLYKNDLKSKMDSKKRDAIIDSEGATKAEHIKLSKKLYNNIIGWDAKDFGSIIQNQGYFQHGVIHDIVDAKEFVWAIKKEND